MKDMIKDNKLLTIIQGDNSNIITVEGEPVLLDVLRDNGVSIAAACSGDGRCGQCRVRVRGEVTPPDERERQLTDGCATDKNGCVLRLACRVRLTGDCCVWIDTAQSKHKLKEHLPEQMPKAHTAPYGVAVDLGTTTIGMRAVDLITGEPLAQRCELNDQRVCGADVMTRIAYCSRSDGLSTLHRLISSQLSRMTALIGGGRMPEYMIIAGNTVMLHLLAGIDPSHIGKAPYHTREHFGRWFDAHSLNLPSKAWLMPCIGGFTGGDLVAALLALTASEREEKDGLALCDLGTNGEMAVFNGQHWMVTSAAAGPALEGGGISCGSGAVKGAVTTLRADEKGGMTLFSDEDEERIDVRCEVLGETQPISLTGPALISLTALLLEKGKIEPSGLMETESWRLGENIAYTRADVRQLQLAKGAVAAALLRLCEEYCDSKKSNYENDCLHICLNITGGLGCLLNPKDAAAIGLTPALEGCSIGTRFLPNLALEGAVLCLEESARSRAADIADRAQVLELTDDDRFDQLFVGCMRLGEPDQDYL